MSDLDPLALQRAEARIREHEATIATLTTELDETNHGVVALYAELDDQAMRLREATELKSRFLSYMSHEFRTPLGSIRSLTRILLSFMDGPLTDEQQKQVLFIQSAATELTEMVDDLLDLAKVEAGRVTISPAWFEMVDLFSALRGMFKPIISNEAINVVFEEPTDAPRLYTDDKKLSQILRNFISNALKFTHRGEVRIRAELSENDTVTFSVIDTGIGIPPEQLKQLFQDFVQVGSPFQRHIRGTGLGLALSQRFAALLGGAVWAVSEVGRGSTFAVRIPIRLPESPSGG